MNVSNIQRNTAQIVHKAKDGGELVAKNVKHGVVRAANTVKGKISDIDIGEVITQAARMPGIHIDRKRFLTKEFRKYCDEEQIKEAIRTTPAKAHISQKIIERIAKSVINYETSKVVALSTVAGIPGGVAAAGAVVVDITQYYAFLIRVLQKLAYLYGYPEFEFNEDEIDDATMADMLIFLGVMFGIGQAQAGLKIIAEIAAEQLPKRLARQALTKTFYYPIVNQVAKALGARMTKEIFANSVGKVIPVLGGFASGGLSLITFRPCCNKLKKELEQSILNKSNQACST